jgi:hypothetical protein
MKNRLRFKYPHKTGEIVIPNFVSSGEKYIHELASEIKCGGYRCFTKDDPKERAMRNIDKNNRKLKKLINELGIKTEGYAEKVERLYQESLKSPEESKPNG